jgi:uncharacterized membrane protein
MFGKYYKKMPVRSRWHWKKLLQYFLQGLVILAPLGITIWAIVTIFEKIDSIIPIRIPGLGFIIVIAFVLLVGYISTFFIMGRLIDLFDSWLERTPGIKFIYSSVKDFFEAFAGDKKKFDKTVLVNIDAEDVWRIGFLTDENASEFGMPGYYAVYVPQSYAFAGHLYIVKPERVKKLYESGISAGNAMKYAISGGVTQVEEEETKPAS